MAWHVLSGRGLLMAALLFVLCGCASTEKKEAAADDTGNYFEVSAEGTPFYKLGPQQPKGPDLSLERGRVVKMLRRTFGYSYIELDNGWQGYVATNDLKQSEGGFDNLLTGDMGGLMPAPTDLYNSTAINEHYMIGEDGQRINLGAGAAPAPELPSSTEFPSAQPDPVPSPASN